MKFRRKTLWRYIKQKQHKFFESYPFLGLFGTWNSSSNKQSSTTLKKNRGHETQSYKKKLSLELINEAMLKTNSDKWHELETATLDSRNGGKWYKDGLKLRQPQRKVQLKIIKYQKATWLPLQYVKWQVLKDKGHTLPPSPQEGLINPHYHTHGATSPQSPSNLQPSTSPALISACSMGAIPNHSILHPLPHPPPHPSGDQGQYQERNFSEKNF